MAVSDLMNETEKGEIVLDDDGEKKVGFCEILSISHF